MNRQTITMMLLGALLLAGCEQRDETAQATVPERQFTTAQLARGKALFQQNCVECHGAAAQGAFGWQLRQADGKFLPPPLNGSGHAWHHPRAVLFEVIENGTQPNGNMPAWRDKLTPPQIGDIVAWLQSLWPEQAYAAWWQIDQRAQRASD